MSFDIDTLNLPSSVKNRVQFRPYEDVLMAIFQRGLPDLPFTTFISEDVQFPVVVGERFLRQGTWDGDPRGIDTGPVRINVFTKGLNGLIEAQLISEAIRVMMFQAHRERWHFPGVGSVLGIRMVAAPVEGEDWATASGIVQFADLFKGAFRYETVYNMTIRRPSE